MSSGRENNLEKYNSKCRMLKGSNKKMVDALFSELTLNFTFMCKK